MDDLERIAAVKAYKVIEKIADGCSGDEKYKLQKDGKYFLLRLGDKTKSSEKKKEYDQLAIYADRDMNIQKPIVFGTAADKFYSIVSWVDGMPIMDIIKKNTSKDYYDLGKKVGRELNKLHSLAPTGLKADWQDIIERRAARFLEKYHRIGIEFDGSKNAEQYIRQNFCLMSDRPRMILHGDFHWNNCVVDTSGNVGIIDFSGNNIGDPWYEFGGLLWALEYSDSFANGQIDGYFDVVPEAFWKIFKFYVALYAFEHLTYSSDTPEDIKSHIFNAERMINIFGKNFEQDIPLFRKQVL